MKIAVAQIFAAITLYLFSGPAAYADNPVRVLAGNQEFIVELAIGRGQQQTGLMHRSSLLPSNGLLMVFERPRQAPIWMKNMNFPLDVVWLSRSGRVLEVATLPVCKQIPCPIHRPDQAASYVLEVGANLFPLNAGDKVEIIHLSGDSRHPPR